MVRLDVWIFPRGGDYGEEELQAGRDRLEVAAGERAHRERNQDSRCRVRTLGVTQVTGVLAPRRADRGRELARANERDTVDIVN